MAGESMMAHVDRQYCYGPRSLVCFHSMKINTEACVLLGRNVFKCGRFCHLLSALAIPNVYAELFSGHRVSEFGCTSQKNHHYCSPLHAIQVPPLQACYLHLSKDNYIQHRPTLVPAGLERQLANLLSLHSTQDRNQGLQEGQRVLPSLSNKTANLRC